MGFVAAMLLTYFPEDEAFHVLLILMQVRGYAVRSRICGCGCGCLCVWLWLCMWVVCLYVGTQKKGTRTLAFIHLSAACTQPPLPCTHRSTFFLPTSCAFSFFMQGRAQQTVPLPFPAVRAIYLPGDSPECCQSVYGAASAGMCDATMIHSFHPLVHACMI